MTIERVLLTQRCCKYSEYKWQNNPFGKFPDFISYLILGSNCNFLLAIDCENDYVKIRRVRPFAMKIGSETTRFLQNDSTLFRKASSISTHTQRYIYIAICIEKYLVVSWILFRYFVFLNKFCGLHHCLWWYIVFYNIF